MSYPQHPQYGQPGAQQPPPPPAFGPPPPYSSTNSGPAPPGFIHTTEPAIITIQPVTVGLTPNPAQVTCPKCNAMTLTETNMVPGLLTYLASGGLLLFGCWLGCCLIPCCIPDCMDVEHRCSNCRAHIGSYRRL